MASYPLKPYNLHLRWLKGLSPALMVGKLGCVPGACASDGWCGCIWLCLVLCACQTRWLFFLQVGGLARCVLLTSLSSESGFKFLFYIRMHGRYTDSCHSIFSKIVFITYMSLRKVGHCGDPPDGVSCGSPMFSICNKFCIFP